MNSYLLNRALGSITPSDFHVALTTRLVHNLEPAPGLRFSSRKGTLGDGDAIGYEDEIYAHKAGVNVLACDQNEGRL